MIASSVTQTLAYVEQERGEYSVLAGFNIQFLLRLAKYLILCAVMSIFNASNAKKNRCWFHFDLSNIGHTICCSCTYDHFLSADFTSVVRECTWHLYFKGSRRYEKTNGFGVIRHKRADIFHMHFHTRDPCPISGSIKINCMLRSFQKLINGAAFPRVKCLSFSFLKQFRISFCISSESYGHTLANCKCSHVSVSFILIFQH